MSNEQTIEDGFGSYWSKCDKPNCGLHVVRPGKVQCDCDSDPVAENTRSNPMTEQDRAEFEAWRDNGGISGVVRRSWSIADACESAAEAAWLASRRTQDAKVRELVEAVLKWYEASKQAPDNEGDFHKAIELVSTRLKTMITLAAHLKEQDDE